MDVKLNLTTENVVLAMVTNPVIVGPETTVREVIRLLNEHKTGSLLVCDEQEVLLGIFTERDAVRMMAKAEDLDQPIEAAMTRDPQTLGIEATVGTAVQSMAGGGYRRLPIVDKANRPLGIVKTSGIVHYLVEHFPAAIYNLPPDSQPVMQEREGA